MNRETPPGRRERRKAATRLAIIAAAVEIADRQGYDRTTTSAIATRAGVSPATVFNYFPSKLDIFFADAARYRQSPALIPYATPGQTLAEALTAVVHDDGWTVPFRAPLTHTWFALVQREPTLSAHRTRLLMDAAPVWAEALRNAHPELTITESLALAGSTLGGLATVLAHAPEPNLVDRLAVLARVMGAEPAPHG